jgi:ectoine hydroxylase-related dioxygenase (phytanoyl-CoA dioxygenase family)
MLTTIDENSKWADIVAILERDGGVILKGFLSADHVASMNKEIDARVAQSTPGSKTCGENGAFFHGSKTKRFTNLPMISPTFVETILESKRFKEYGDHYLLALAGGYWMNTAQAMIVGPGSTPQFLHRDQANWPAFDKSGPEHDEVTVSIMFALSDFTEEVGATRVIPKSHLWKDCEREGLDEETVGAVMKAGSALFYLGSTIHGAGKNTTDDEWRRGLHASFVVGWLTPEEAFPLEITNEEAKSFSPWAQQLLGFRGYNPEPHSGGRLWQIDYEDPAVALDL